MKMYIFLYKSLKLIWKSDKISLISISSINILLGIIPLINVLIMKKLVNKVVEFIHKPQQNLNEMIIFLSLQFLMLLLNSFFSKYLLIVTTKMEQKIEYELKTFLAKFAIKVPFENYENHQFYNYLQRAKGDIGNRFTSSFNVFVEIVKNSITIISLVVFLIQYHWILAMICLLSALPVYFVQAKFGRQKFHLMKYQTPIAREYHYIFSLLSSRNSNMEMRLFQIGPYMIKKWAKLFKSNNKEILKLLSRKQRMSIVLDGSTFFLFVGAAGIVLWLITKKLIKVGDFVAITNSVRETQKSINVLATNFATLYERSLFVKDFYDFIDMSKEEDGIVRNESFPKLKDGIQVEELSFTYPFTNKKALNKVSLFINKGEKIAIVGENGSGKSTFVKCLVGLYDLVDGNIKFNNTSINTIDKNSLYKNIAVIFQDFIQYNFTVKENIGFGDIENFNESKIYNVANQIGADQFIDKLPKQFETRLGRLFESSEDLSGGQWQRIALARALIRDAQILVLDEPTSALDPITEALIFEQFKNITENKTSIFISHRMYSSKFADRIIVMKEGEVSEMGTFNDLINRKGEFHRLYTLQANLYKNIPKEEEVHI